MVNPKTVGSTPAPATEKEELKPNKKGIYKGDPLKFILLKN